MATTNKDVAKRAGVSIATVSRVINGLPNVAPETQRRVERAVKALRYQPSRTAQRLRVKTSRVLGLIISDIENPFFTSVVRGIEDLAYENGYSLVLCNSDENAEKQRLYIEVMRAEAVAGVIIASTSENNPDVRTLLDHGIPVVALDRRIKKPRVDSVCVANSAGAFQAVEHLIQLGHRRIGLVTMQSIPTGAERQHGYLLAHRKYGLRASPQLTAAGIAKPAGGYECALRLLEQKERPTALFVNNNMMMLGVLQAVHECGLRVPDELSVVSFDDTPWAPLLQPPLTVVAQPTYELGRKAVEHLLERLSQPARSIIHEQLTPLLIIRGSTGAPPNGSGTGFS